MVSSSTGKPKVAILLGTYKTSWLWGYLFVIESKVFLFIFEKKTLFTSRTIYIHKLWNGFDAYIPFLMENLLSHFSDILTEMYKEYSENS